jgi:multidrug resistance efflux pump
MAEKNNASDQAANPVRRITLVVISIAALLFFYGMISDRFTPHTSQAVVQGYLVRIAPEVGGRVIEIPVGTDQKIEPGSVLFRIDPEQYQLAVRRAEAQLAAAGQSIGANTASVASAQAKLAEAVAKRENTRDQTARDFELVKKGIYAEARGVKAKAQLEAAEATVSQAEAELEKARQTLGPKGADNPQIREAMVALQQANLDLARTSVLAPTEGGVTNLSLTTGQLLSKGEAAMTYIDIREVWVEAAFRENSLEHIQVGDAAAIALDVLPGRVYSGKVKSVGYGVSNRSMDPRTGLPKIDTQRDWIRSPQPFPVRVEFEGELPKSIRYGSQANVTVYATGSYVLNAIAWIKMRLVSILSYVQ